VTGYAYGPGRIVDVSRPRIDFDADPAKLDEADLDTLERQAAEIMAAVRREFDRRHHLRATLGARFIGGGFPRSGALEWPAWGRIGPRWNGLPRAEDPAISRLQLRLTVGWSC